MAPPAGSCGRRTIDPEPRRLRLARFLVAAVLATVRAELLDLETIGIVATVLAGDVVTVLALLAGERDLRANVGGGHVSCLFLLLAERYELTAKAANLSGMAAVKRPLAQPHNVPVVELHVELRSGGRT